MTWVEFARTKAPHPEADGITYSQRIYVATNNRAYTIIRLLSIEGRPFLFLFHGKDQLEPGDELRAEFIFRWRELGTHYNSDWATMEAHALKVAQDHEREFPEAKMKAP